MSTLIGMVTYGNTEFTKLSIKGIRETVKEPYELFIVVGKPYDIPTIKYLEQEDIPHIIHDFNWGFPKSVNDIYDYAWKEHRYDNLIIIGNDVVPYPYAIDSLIKVAETTDYSWICSRQLDAKSLVANWPETKKYFEGPLLKFTDFETTQPWMEVPAGYSDKVEIDITPLSDVHNLALFKRNVFDTLGYIDVNFYPAYYEDNDYVRRAVHVGLKSCTVSNSIYFHFWSRTIHQGSGGSTDRFFQMNRNFYVMKWGGDFGKEQYEVPFDGRDFVLGEITHKPVYNIVNRDSEESIIKFWYGKGGSR
jgi:GT2 family glycosyltransferase